MAKDIKAAAANETAASQPDIVYVLATPVTFRGETILDIPYRRPKGRDVRRAFKARNDGGDMYLAMLVEICEQPQELFDAIDGSDYIALIEICDGFLSPPKVSKAA